MFSFKQLFKKQSPEEYYKNIDDLDLYSVIHDQIYHLNPENVYGEDIMPILKRLNELLVWSEDQPERLKNIYKSILLKYLTVANTKYEYCLRKRRLENIRLPRLP